MACKTQYIFLSAKTCEQDAFQKFLKMKARLVFLSFRIKKKIKVKKRKYISSVGNIILPKKINIQSITDVGKKNMNFKTEYCGNGEKGVI